MAEEKASMWLRITEIIIGLIVLVLGGYVVAYPGVAAATLIGFLAVGIFILSFVEFARIFSEGISGWQRLLRLILSVIVFLLAIAILVSPLIWGRINPCVVGRTGVDLFGIRGHRTRHSRDDSSRHHRSNSRLCRVFISSARRSHCSTFAGDSSDHIRVRVDSIRPLGKMGITHSLLLFLCG